MRNRHAWRRAVALTLNKHCKTNGFLLNLSSEMQTVIQVIATGTGSLRNKIMSDSQLEKKFGFIKVMDTSSRGVRMAGRKSIVLATFMERLIWNGTDAAEH